MIERTDRSPRYFPGGSPTIRLLTWLLAVLALLGPAVFAARAAGEHPERAWFILIINAFIWSEVAQGGVAISAFLDSGGARWTTGIRRIAESTGAYLPVSVLLHIVMGAGLWVQFPVRARYGPSYPRPAELAASIALDLLCMSYVIISLRPELGPRDHADHSIGGRLRAIMTFRWRGTPEERGRRGRILSWFAPVLLICYLLEQTLIISRLVGERVLLIIPSLSNGTGNSIGIAEVVISGGFAATFALMAGRFILNFPPPGRANGAQFSSLR